jgi:trehalose utilization protein
MELPKDVRLIDVASEASAYGYAAALHVPGGDQLVLLRWFEGTPPMPSGLTVRTTIAQIGAKPGPGHQEYVQEVPKPKS